MLNQMRNQKKRQLMRVFKRTKNLTRIRRGVHHLKMIKLVVSVKRILVLIIKSWRYLTKWIRKIMNKIKTNQKKTKNKTN
jgi:hypothetical protein